MKNEMTLGELIESEKFQTLLAERIEKILKEYYEAVKKINKQNRKVKRNPMMRLYEMGAEDPKKMTQLYIGIIDQNSELSAILREYVKAICEPILYKCLLDLMREQREKEAENGTEAQP